MSGDYLSLRMIEQQWEELKKEDEEFFKDAKQVWEEIKKKNDLQ